MKKFPHLIAMKSCVFGGIAQIISRKFRVCTSHLVATRMAKSEPLILRFFRIATKKLPTSG